MKNKIKNILIPLFIIFSLLFLLSAGETEPNNTSQTATAININEICTGALSGSQDVDWYTFSINNAGKVNITFRMQMKENDNYYYRIYVCPSTNPDRILLDRIISGYTTESSLASIGLPAGRYYVRIQASNYPPASFSTADYSFTVNYEQNDNWEKEFNDSWSTATGISLQQSYYGSLSGNQDDDWYTFSLNNAGKVNMTFLMQMKENDNYYYRIYVYPSTNPDRILLDRIISGYMTESSLASIGLPAGRYYVRIRPSGYPPASYSGADYSFSVNYTQGDNWEKEFNDSWSTATEISLQQRYYGSLSGNQDFDWYTFSLSSAGKVNITFWSQRMSNNNNYYVIYVHPFTNPDNAFLSQTVSGYTTETNMTSSELQAGKYYISIRPSGYPPASYSGVDYSFIVQD